MSEENTTVEETESTDMFPRSYVEELRAEAKANREALADAQSRLDAILSDYQRVYAEYLTRDILQDAKALEWSDDFMTEDGLVDADKVKEAAETLAHDKPYLAKARGDAAQGYTETEQPFDLVSLMRS